MHYAQYGKAQIINHAPF